MRNLILLLLACIAPFSSFGQGVASFGAQDMQALHQVAEKWEQSWNRHDMEAFATLFADDVQFVTKSGTWFQGKQATMNHHKQNHATVFKNSTWTTDNVAIKYVKPDVALIHIGWGLSGDSHHDGTPSSPRHGISTWVVEKRQGQWLLLAVHNVNIETPR